MKRNRFFEIAFLFEMGLGLAAVLIACPLGLRLWDYCSFNPSDLGISIAATGLAVLIYLLLQTLPFAWLRRVADIVRTIYRTEMQTLSLWQLALLALAAGFGEELLFRGLLQQGLCNWFPGKEWGVIVAVSLLFGMAHCLTATYAVLAFLISLYLGVLYYWTGNLLVPIIVHALYDFFVFCHLYLEFRTSARPAE